MEKDSSLFQRLPCKRNSQSAQICSILALLNDIFFAVESELKGSQLSFTLPSCPLFKKHPSPLPPKT